LAWSTASPEFERHPYVINGCSELFAAVGGRKNGSAFAARLGFGSLPDNIPVEIESYILSCNKTKIDGATLRQGPGSVAAFGEFMLRLHSGDSGAFLQAGEYKAYYAGSGRPIFPYCLQDWVSLSVILPGSSERYSHGRRRAAERAGGGRLIIFIWRR